MAISDQGEWPSIVFACIGKANWWVYIRYCVRREVESLCGLR